MTPKGRQFVISTKRTFFRARFLLAKISQKISRRAGPALLTVATIPLVAALYLPMVQSHLGPAVKDLVLTYILIGIATVFGSMVALVSTLSIIPIQRAADTMTPSIRRIFVRDRKIVLTLLVLSLFCVTTFLASLRELFGNYQALVFPVFIWFAAIAFDLLRFHQNRISLLLEPAVALDLLTAQTASTMDKTSAELNSIAQIFPPAEAAKDPAALPAMKSVMYESSGLDNLLLARVCELVEIAIKSANRHEPFTATLSCKNIAKLTNQFLDLRAETIRFQATFDYGVRLTTSVDRLVQDVLESLRELAFVAADNKQSGVILSVTDCIAEISGRVSAIRDPQRDPAGAPLAYLPQGYVRTCIQNAVSLGLEDEVVLQGAQGLRKISTSAPNDTRVEDIHALIIKGLAELSTELLKKRKSHLAFPVQEQILQLMFHLYRSKHFQFDSVLTDVLEVARDQIPLSIPQVQGFKEYPFYATVSNISLPAFLKEAMNRYLEHSEAEAADVERQGRAVEDLCETLEALCRHFREVAERLDLNAFHTLWTIIASLKEATLDLLKIYSVEARSKWDRDKLRTYIVKLTLLPQWLFYAKRVNQKMADDACDAASYIGLAALDSDVAEVPEAAINTISNVVRAFAAAGTSDSHYNYADMMMSIWHIREYARVLERHSLVTQCDERLAKPEALTDEIWAHVLEAFELRKRQLQDELKNYGLNLLGSAEALFVQLIRDRR